MKRKNREGLAGFSCVRDSTNNGRPNFIFANWSSSGNLHRISCLRQTFIYSPFIVQFQICIRYYYYYLNKYNNKQVEQE